MIYRINWELVAMLLAAASLAVRLLRRQTRRANLSPRYPTTLAERNRPHYQALGFGLSVILAVGALAYWPMRESTNDLKARNTELVQSIQMLSSETNKTIQLQDQWA